MCSLSHLYFAYFGDPDVLLGRTSGGRDLWEEERVDCELDKEETR